jgi:plastocyanin
MDRRLLTCLCALTLATACGGGGSQPAAAVPAAVATAPVPAVTFKESEFKIDPAAVTLKPGSYLVKVENDGQFPHDLHIAPEQGGDELGRSVVLAGQGSSTTFQVTLQPGTYEAWCAVGDHRVRGMEATLTVQ